MLCTHAIIFARSHSELAMIDSEGKLSTSHPQRTLPNRVELAQGLCGAQVAPAWASHPAWAVWSWAQAQPRTYWWLRWAKQLTPLAQCPPTPTHGLGSPLSCHSRKFPSWRATLKHIPKGLRGMSDNPSAWFTARSPVVKPGLDGWCWKSETNHKSCLWITDKDKGEKEKAVALTFTLPIMYID